MADFSDAFSKGAAALTKVSKLASPSTYQSSSSTFSMPAGFSASVPGSVPNIANGVGTPTLGYAATPDSTSNASTTAASTTTPGVDPLRDARASCWQPNILSGVEQPTYHIRFYMTEDTPLPLSNYTTYKDYYAALQKLKQTTIAESGVTGLAITGLSIETMTAPNPMTRSMSAKTITLTVVEPMGVSFFDMIAQSAADLQIMNFTKVSYFIDVKFIGYNSGVGTANMNVCQDFDNGGVWTYRVRLGNVDVDSNSAVSTYTFTAMPYDEHIFNTDDLKLPTTFKPVGSTVGEMLSSLAQKLNEHEQYSYGYNIKTYAFRTAQCRIDGSPEDPASWSINQSDLVFNDQRAMPMNSDELFDKNSPAKGTFPSGANINDVIEMIIVASERGQLFAKDVQKPNETKKDDGKPRRSLIFRYEPTIEVTGYDPITRQYTETITIDILSYVTMIPVVEQNDVTRAQTPDKTNEQMQVDQAKSLTSAGYMCKRYDYMFTGLNTEVLNFDFKYNFTFEVVLPQLYGYQNSNASFSDNAKMRDDPQDIQAVQMQNQNLLAHQKELDALISKYSQSADLAQQQLATNKDNKDAQAQYAQAEASLKVLNDASAQLTAKLQNNAGTIGKLAQQKGLQLNPLNPRVPASRTPIKYAEDLINAHEVPRYPVGTRQSGDDPRENVAKNITESYTRDRSIYGSILDQLYQPVAQSLLQINLSIKGDPYWLGVGNVERAIRLFQGNKNGEVRDHFGDNVISNKQVDHSYGDIMFLLTFKYPLTTGDDGTPVLKSNESFTGIYRVVSIKHEFRDGQFKQEITALRCPLIDAFKALGNSVIEIPNTSTNSGKTVGSQANPNATAKTTTASNSTLPPVPDAPAYAELKPPIPPNMPDTSTNNKS